MHLDFNSCYTSAANSKILAFFEQDHENSLVVYSNTAVQAKKSHVSLKRALDESKLRLSTYYFFTAGSTHWRNFTTQGCFAAIPLMA
jgi:hypothetical protein